MNLCLQICLGWEGPGPAIADSALGPVMFAELNEFVPCKSPNCRVLALAASSGRILTTGACWGVREG